MTKNSEELHKKECLFTRTKTEEIIFLFDIDGTLTPPRDPAPPEIIEMLKNVRSKVLVGFVGGSDLVKQQEQLGSNILDLFDYGFPENGTQFYRNGTLIKSESIIDYLGLLKNCKHSEKYGLVGLSKDDAPVLLYSDYQNIAMLGEAGDSAYDEIVRIIQHLFSMISLPVKRGTFIELRRSLINISPIGRTCTREERNSFQVLDKKIKLLDYCCKYLNDALSKYNLECVNGGQISIDIYPRGWDKTYCLQYIDAKRIFFFGDKTFEGGNDFAIYNHPRVIGHTVTGTADTISQVKQVLEELGLE